MHRFTVWAPCVEAVKLVLGDRRIPMTQCGDGWWCVEHPAPPGTEYSFAVGDSAPLPDPRSLYQAAGIHGPSQTIDHFAFAWTDSGWRPAPLGSGLVYELHIGTFSSPGTFDGAIAHLQHLVELGVTHVELMPVNEFPGTRGWGYDGVHLYAPHHAYGGPEGLKRFVDACHRHGLAVILDVVYNHLGPSGNYLPQFGPYFTDRHHTPWGSAVNLDGRGSDEVRRFFCDNALGWLRDYHIDGLRLDAVHAIVDTSAIHFLEQLAAEVAELETTLGRHLLLIAESDLNDPRLIRPPEAGGYGLHAQWNDDVHHALHVVLSGERQGYYEDFDGFRDLARALARGFVYDGRPSRSRGRRHGRPATAVLGHRFVAYLQNHDQIGNRARGDRSSALLSPGRLKMAAALLLTSPFVPMLFQGEEWGASSPFQYFVEHEDEDLARAVRDGRRQEFAAFGWQPQEIPDPQSPETFERSRLNWSERAVGCHAELLAWHRELIRLRRSTQELLDGRLDRVCVQYSEADRWLTVRRGTITTVCNLSSHRQVVPVLNTAPTTVRLASAPGVVATSQGVELPADGVAILQMTSCPR